MPHISIITTTYNHADYIAHTIESVLSQTFDNWTMYIGDDSPDTRTWDIISTYVEKYPDKIKAYRNIPSLGIVGNMNRLIGYAVHSMQYTGKKINIEVHTQTHTEDTEDIHIENEE
jgi:glycosyltransferase involved in cell wall biosynthesis